MLLLIYWKVLDTQMMVPIDWYEVGQEVVLPDNFNG